VTTGDALTSTFGEGDLNSVGEYLSNATGDGVGDTNVLPAQFSLYLMKSLEC
jgi:hypothetical protein